jgi:hypothetical protein
VQVWYVVLLSLSLMTCNDNVSTPISLLPNEDTKG